MKTLNQLILLFCSLTLAACHGRLQNAEKQTVIIQAPSEQDIFGSAFDRLPMERALVSITPKPYIEFHLTQSATPGASAGFGFKDRVLLDVRGFEFAISQVLLARGSDSVISLSNLSIKYSFISDMAGVYIHVFIFSGEQRIAGSAYNRINKDYSFRNVDDSGRRALSDIIFNLLLDAIDATQTKERLGPQTGSK